MKSALLLSFLLAFLSIAAMTTVNAQNSTNTTMGNSTMNSTMSNSTMMENTTMMANTTMDNTTMMMNTTMGNSTMMENTTMMMNSTTMAPNTTMMMNTTMAPMNSTTMMPNSTMMPPNTTSGNDTMMPTNGSEMPSPMPPPPMLPSNCSSLMVQECFWNTSCFVFKKQPGMNPCTVRCEMLKNQGDCSSMDYCSWQADSSHCVPNCGSLSNYAPGCMETPGCGFYGGMCYNLCRKIDGQTSCEAQSNFCMWSTANGKQKCKPKCNLANADAYLCEQVISGPRDDECAWDRHSKTCNNKCDDLDAAMCNATMGRCVWFNKDCRPNCSMAKHADECSSGGFGSDCQWVGMKCRHSCGAAGSNTDLCNSWPGCYSNEYNSCVPGNCPAYHSFDDCKNRHSAGYCNFIQGQCQPTCNMAGMANASCPMEPVCTQGGGSCADQACNYSTIEGDCNGRSSCSWVDGACKPACSTAYNMDMCSNWNHCWWRYGPLPIQGGEWTCVPKCNMLMSSESCNSTYSFGRAPICSWDPAANKCRSFCGLYNWNSTKCLANPNCEWNDVVEMCTPKCMEAMNEMECMNSQIYGVDSSCFWDKDTSKCRKACEMSPNSTAECTAPCQLNAEFGRCTMMSMPPPSTTTMMPAGNSTTTMMPAGNSTTTSANGTMMGSSTTAAGNETMMGSTTVVTGAAGSTTTAAGTGTSSNSTGAAGSTTTMAAGTTTTMAPTTAAPPVGIPRVQFVVTTNATGNVTVEAFTNKLASLLGVPASSLKVSIPSAGLVDVEFIDSANANTEYTAAQNLNPTELSSLGAASVSTLTPATTTAPEDGDDDKMPLIIGCAVGGFVLLVIILVVVKKSSSGGTGAQYLEDDNPTTSRHGDAPMLQVPQRAGQPAL